jgi:hypothetical protein
MNMPKRKDRTFVPSPGTEYKREYKGKEHTVNDRARLYQS